MNGFYTYLHSKPDGSVFYIGKGLGDRVTSKENRNVHWHRTVQKYGYEPKVLAQWASEEEAFEHERFLIACFRDMGAKLVNMTNGGEGSAGYRWSEEQRAMNPKRFGQDNPMHGRKQSAEAKEKIRQLALGRKISDETRKRIAAALTGRQFSAEHARKLSIAGSGGNNPTARKCLVDGVEFDCARAAARHLGIHGSTVARRCRSQTFPNYVYIS
jgi:group I intron endonuclease